MAATLKALGALIVGFGWTGPSLDQRLRDAGLELLPLERGLRDTPPSPLMQD